MAFVAELLGWWLFAIVKFLFLPSVMIFAEKSYVETVLVSSSGAALGILLISFFGERLFLYISARERRMGKPIITKRRRQIVRLKGRFGLGGLIAVSALISVPLSTLLATKYFRHVPFMRLKMIVGFFVWANVLTAFAWYIRTFTNG
jgi:hypothetical protein